MNLKIFFEAVCLCASTGVEAQSVANAYKGVSNGNPISACVFCADPTALEFDGRVYVYGSNDSQQFLVNNKKGSNGYGAIKSLVVFSTDDMVNWTFHGTIDVGKLCTSWGWRFAASWAPSVTWREGANGKNEFFLYFANSGGSVGVLTANSPIGPWRSPLTRPLIDGDTPGVAPCNWIFDPGVVIDDNGAGWIAFGGGDPNSQGTKLMPGNSRIAKLRSNMISLEGKAVNLPAPYLFEASELNMMNGRYVYTYNTSWSDRNDWNSYAKRGSYPAPSSCSMCYMVTDDPLNPDAWEYKGEYVANPGNFGFGWGNNHTHLQKFQGNYYLFYHSMVLEQKMNTGASGFRSIGVEKATVNENKQQISKVTMTNQGPSAIKKMNPYSLQQAETMSTSGGVNYEDFTNIEKVAYLNTLGNDASKNMQVKMNAGAWTMVRNVDFGTEGANSFILRAKGTGKLEIRLENISAKPSASVELSSTDFMDYTISVESSLFKGVKKVFFLFTEANNVYFDAWQFSKEDAAGIQALVSNDETTRSVYDLSGKKYNSNQGMKSGVYIRNGKKVVVRQ
jgi:arabinoxylan arabinofuranohydrolase